MGAGCSVACYSKSVAPQRSESPFVPNKKSPGIVQVTTKSRPSPERRRNSYTNLQQLNLFDSPKNESSSIQENNILYRHNYAYSPRHHSSLLELSTVKTKSKTSPRPVASDSQSIKHAENGGGFFKNLSGSVQNLTLFGGDRSRAKSASENNLAHIPKDKLNRKSNSIIFGENASLLSGKSETDSKSRGGLKKLFDLPRLKRNKDRRKM